MPDILYFAESPGAPYEALYLLPFIRLTGGIFMTDHEETLERLKAILSGDVKLVYGDKEEMLSSSHSVVVYANFYPRSEGGKHVLFMHGVADKRGIARPYTFKDQRTFLYRASMALPKDAFYNPLSPAAVAPFKWLRRLMRNRFDLLLLPGKALYDLYRGAGAIRRDNYRIIGFPRFDPIFSGELDKSGIIESLGLDPDRKTVLYAPTWHGKHEFDMNSMSTMGNAIIDATIERYNLIVRPHPRTIVLGEAGNVISRLRKLSEERDNVILVDDPFYDTVELMAIADLMISDYSSVGIEFLALDKPIVFADPLGDRYNDNSLAEIYIRDAGYIIIPGDNIVGTIAHALSHPEEKSAIRRRYADYFFSHRDGKAGERGASAIMELLEKVV